MNEETRRFDIQLLADVFADLDQTSAALPAGARCRLMAVFDTRQLWRDRLATGRLWPRFLGGALKLCQFSRNCGLIFVAGFEK